MKHRTLTAFAITAVLAATGSWVSFDARADEGGEAGPCNATSFKYKAVETACNSGGQKKAKELMKAAVKKMKADGKDVNCKSCHTSLKTYENKSNAVDDLKGYI